MAFIGFMDIFMLLFLYEPIINSTTQYLYLSSSVVFGCLFEKFLRFNSFRNDGHLGLHKVFMNYLKGITNDQGLL
ncbi:hypothetical protein OIU74_013522 [Salix koriyanagi]|uniref:Uncharacterized protein n=1 Tax=Salix koriyanagi TaxID=2511006 RepID=A0A9Q0Q9N0_9ROSI|nr:hypothetical protein OIU74_013522 [Salix koriyanagi]